MVRKVKDLTTKEETIRDDISDPDWQPLANNVRTKPPEDTIFVVVDVREPSESSEPIGDVKSEKRKNKL
ncbi:hypothetical protein ACJ73_09686 [Blastomyces percursus]|uniref:Uncharacterized protein n=1 Tax=Blastomyces percursus TaxID=1658174 RepID=A0A1J9Q4H1_9EURO|nr:hypothetical protein ACJ73_09686 [Blastomyces percursus]